MRIKRSLTLADMMILVLTLAVGSLCLRLYLPGFNEHASLDDQDVFVGLELYVKAIYWAMGPATCLVIPCMATLVVIRLWPPRPRLYHLQPGFVACVAVMVSIVPGIFFQLSNWQDSDTLGRAFFANSWGICTHWASTAVLGAWIALYFSDRWRPEPSWIDRLGRILGLYWIAILVAWIILCLTPTTQEFLSKWTV